MSIKDFLELNEISFGVVKPNIRVISPDALFSTSSFSVERLKNMFIYTGVPSVVKFNNTGNSDNQYYPFDSYVNLWDLYFLGGGNNNLLIQAVIPQFMMFNDIVIVPGSNWGISDGGSDPCRFSNFVRQRWYLVEYDFKKLMKF